MFHRSEITALAISVFIMALALGFNDKSEVFVWSFWLANFFMILLMVAFSFVLHQVAHKIVAKRHGFEAEYSLWGIQGFSFKPTPWKYKEEKPFPRAITLFGKKYLIKAFPVGIVLSLLVTLVSNGLLFFLAVGQYTLLLKRGARFGRKFIEVTGYEEAQIAIVGPLTHVVLMVLASFFNQYGTFDTFIFVNAALAVFYLIPLHHLDGAKVFFGSRLLYVASLIFVLSTIVLVYYLPVIPMLILSVVATAIGAGLYYYYSYFK